MNGGVHAGHLPTGVRPFRGFPHEQIPIAGKTGTAQGRDNDPQLDSAVFAAFQLDPGGFTVAAYLEKAGYGGAAAAPVVRCMLLALNDFEQMSPVLLSDQLDITATRPAPPKQMPSEVCLEVDTAVTTRER